MGRYQRIFLIVIDSLGIGAAPDGASYGDAGANTLGHIAQHMPTLSIPHLERLGMGALCPMGGLKAEHFSVGRAAVLQEQSRGKDTMTGHWEMMGLETTQPFVTFTETGFPPELIAQLEAATGRSIVGNKSASGTEILDELAMEELNHGKLIVYTSADSVLQICGNEDTMGLETLYHYCELARALTMEEQWKVGRVIARPYVGTQIGQFKRTANRHDYAIKPHGKTVLNLLKDQGLDVISVGKINDIFVGEGVTQSHKSLSSVHGMEQTIALAQQEFQGLCFVNLVDFDALWGHRRDVEGYGKELEAFDQKLGELLLLLREDDLLMITADHGNDPTFKGTDHTRENVPFLAYAPSMQDGKILPVQTSFATIGATIAENFQISITDTLIGTSLLQQI